MAEVIVFTLKLLVVNEIRRTSDSAVMLFDGGINGTLMTTEKGFAYYLTLAGRSLDRRHPVGVRFTSAGRIAEIVRAESDIVVQIIEEADKRIKIWFQGHDGTFYLQSSHPEYKRIHETLVRSMREKRPVWFASNKPVLTLEDAVIVEPQK